MPLKLSDIAELEDTLEVLEMKQKLVEATNNLEAAMVRGDTATMWAAERAIDILTQDIFQAKESILKPYPATQPSELSPMEQQELLPESWKQITSHQ